MPTTTPRGDALPTPRGLIEAALAAHFEAKDRARYDAMSDAELAVHDLDRDSVEDRLRRRYRKG